MTITGGCLCGAVRYEVLQQVFHKTICHCPSCRRAAGAPCVAWFSVARDAFRLTAAAPASYRSSAQVLRTFCPSCGTPLTYWRDDFPADIDITTCSLDAPADVAPDDHTFTQYQLPWLAIDDGLPAYARTRVEG